MDKLVRRPFSFVVNKKEPRCRWRDNAGHLQNGPTTPFLVRAGEGIAAEGFILLLARKPSRCGLVMRHIDTVLFII
ncbi:MAG TPA: hypothetical protein PL151_14190 [Phycisphaerae bacterium]|nr:hypothetical protein [Phycisphaerae bacterium]HOJ75622.1 hypothetical protein [Phycisphaerae bacterium]HOM50276.1 hypothetical protein [Phycisphaerae bacterium]HON69161.1 hypothetical protein [Phycisphaerae bacterium]HOQ88073.1 hypothetical protein [Phycisphaerae bacterium]